MEAVIFLGVFLAVLLGFAVGLVILQAVAIYFIATGRAEIKMKSQTLDFLSSVREIGDSAGAAIDLAVDEYMEKVSQVLQE